MGKKKKQPKPAKRNVQSDVMFKLGAICEKLDTLLGLVNQVLVKITPQWLPYTPTPNTPVSPNEPVIVMYGVRPQGDWDIYKYTTTSTRYPTTGTVGDSAGTVDKKNGKNKC